jgi:hypothetical protein
MKQNKSEKRSDTTPKPLAKEVLAAAFDHKHLSTHDILSRRTAAEAQLELIEAEIARLQTALVDTRVRRGKIEAAIAGINAVLTCR